MSSSPPPFFPCAAFSNTSLRIFLSQRKETLFPHWPTEGDSTFPQNNGEEEEGNAVESRLLGHTCVCLGLIISPIFRLFIWAIISLQSCLGAIFVCSGRIST